MKLYYLHLTSHSPPSQNTNYKQQMFDKIDIQVIRDHYFSPPQESSHPVMMVSMHVERELEDGCALPLVVISSQDLAAVPQSFFHQKWSALWLLLTRQGGTCFLL